MEKWFLKNKKGDVSALAEALSVSPVLAKVLINRDIDTEEKAKAYFPPSKSAHSLSRAVLVGFESRE